MLDKGKSAKVLGELKKFFQELLAVEIMIVGVTPDLDRCLFEGQLGGLLTCGPSDFHDLIFENGFPGGETDFRVEKISDLEGAGSKAKVVKSSVQNVLTMFQNEETAPTVTRVMASEADSEEVLKSLQEAVLKL